MLGPFATASRRYIASHQVSLVARQHRWRTMSTTTTTMRDRGDGPLWPHGMGPITLLMALAAYMADIVSSVSRLDVVRGD